MNKKSTHLILLTALLLSFSITTLSEQTAKNQSKPDLHPIEKIPLPDSIRIPVLDFKNTDIRDVLRGLGIQYGVNIFLEPEVSGQVSLYLNDISVKNAIDFIIKRYNYAYTVENGIIKVYKYKAPPPPPPAKPKVKFSKTDKGLTVDLKEVPATEVARYFSDSAGINVLVDDNVEKKISAKLVNLKPERAVKAIFESRGMAVSMSDGIYHVSRGGWSKEKGSASSKPSQMKRHSISIKDSLISLEVENAPLDQLIRTIAIQSNLNIVIYDRLTGEISAKFDSISVDDALRFLLQNTKFTFWKEKTIYFVGSREMNQQKTTSLISLKHLMADEESISKILPPTILNNAVVKYNKEHNAVIVIGSYDIVAQAKEFIEKIDKPVPQVLIEALVVDFNINKIREYGVSIFTGNPVDSGMSQLNERFLPNLELKPGPKKTARILNSVLNEMGIDKVVDLPDNFRASIQALEAANVVKVHSTPQIATINGNSARITIGETRYYKLTKTTKAPVVDNTVIGTDERFEMLQFNTQLEITPWVMDEGYVMVKIRPEFNIPRQSGNGNVPPNVDTRVIESMVRLRNGQTVVLGGQRQTEDMVGSRGIPILSSIPLLGWLFSSRNISKVETQMMIFLTPHVYYGDDNAVSPDDYFGDEINAALEEFKSEKQKHKNKIQSESEKKDDSEITEKPKTTSVKWYWPWSKKKNIKKASIPVESSDINKKKQEKTESKRGTDK